jgi:hypothetical protein
MKQTFYNFLLIIKMLAPRLRYRSAGPSTGVHHERWTCDFLDGVPSKKSVA